jgi:5-(carboxyamino)imidazole ribonucleotide synthase
VLSLVDKSFIKINLEKNAVMLNLLGDLWFKNGEPKIPNFEEIEGPGINIHLYGKNQPRSGRKMGHITVVGEKLEDLIYKAEEIRLKLQEM